jgi:hypothetical protein
VSASGEPADDAPAPGIPAAPAIPAAHEAPRPVAGDGFSDAVTFSFGDDRVGLFGMARAGIADGAGSGLAVLFAGHATVAARAEGGVALTEPTWEAIDAGGVSTATIEPLERWTVVFDGGEDGGFALEFSAIGAPVAFEGGGMSGYEQLCQVRGAVRVGDRAVEVDCLGQRGHQWGSPDWDHLSMARTLGAWIAADSAVMISAFRAAKAKDHGRDAISAVVLEGTPLQVVEIEEPLLSTGYDEGGHQRRAGWELWPADEEGYARRGAGELLCGTSLDLGRLRLDCAFFRFRMEGRSGVGRYDVLRRA